MMEWLLPVSLCLVSAGIIVSVMEEWKRYGLTDTSFLSLTCWIVGLCGMAGWGLYHQQNLMFLAAAIPIGIFTYWFILKNADRNRRRRKY